MRGHFKPVDPNGHIVPAFLHQMHDPPCSLLCCLAFNLDNPIHFAKPVPMNLGESKVAELLEFGLRRGSGPAERFPSPSRHVELDAAFRGVELP